ncbi:hypothetical protein [Ferrimonas gelatinilytica]|uniref:hypothetical protein n=1 Tax=Ferrimonas gelatinilytica TaxID=1255257 RepID=UPI0031E91021
MQLNNTHKNPLVQRLYAGFAGWEACRIWALEGGCAARQSFGVFLPPDSTEFETGSA